MNNPKFARDIEKTPTGSIYNPKNNKFMTGASDF